MTKPTIIILAVVYLASILIVGIFGMQPRGEVPNYIDSITITEQHLEFSQDKNSLEFKMVPKDKQGYMEYRVLIKPQGELTMTLKKPTIIAKNPDEDPTNSDLSIEYDGSATGITNEGFVFKINGKGTTTITFNSKDYSGKKMVLVLLVK